MKLVHKTLEMIESAKLLRKLATPAGVDFCSNDYLGYSKNDLIHEKLLRFFQSNTKLGSTGSRLVSGNSEQIEMTENFLASTFNSQASLIFSSGYLANLGVISSLGGEQTEFFSDELNHASIIDGIKLSRSRYEIYQHRDTNHLRELVASSPAVQKIIVTESIFSMDGDRAPLDQLAEIAERYGTSLIVDEAHATGVSGPNGLGLAYDLRFDPENLVVIHTAGKALGALGAFVCSSSRFKEFLLNRARTQIFTTSLTPIAVEHIRLAVDYLMRDSSAQEQLRKNVEIAENFFKANGLPFFGGHIIPLIVGDNASVLALEQRMRLKGFFVKAIRSPSVKAGTERLRITIKATHNPFEIENLCLSLKETVDELIYNGD